MNNAINEIKITLEGTMSRITETEDRISEVEDKMVEINEAERKKEKSMKINEDKLKRPLGQCQMPQHLNHRSPRRRRQKGHEKLLEELIAENFPKMGKEIAT